MRSHLCDGMCRYDLALPDAQLVVAERPGWIEGIIFLGNVEGKLGRWKSAAFHWHGPEPHAHTMLTRRTHDAHILPARSILSAHH